MRIEIAAILLSLAVAALADGTNNLSLAESTVYSKSGAQVTIPAENYQCQIGGNGLVQNVQDIPSTNQAALLMGGIGTQGLFRVKNISATNNVDVGTMFDTNFVPFVRLQPGRSARVFLSTNAPYAKASAGTVKIHYMATDN